MSVTLKEIADASSVSISTASRALSGHPGINGETANRVREAAQRMNYRVRQTDVLDKTLEGTEVGIFCLGMGSSLTALPTVAAAIGGAESTLAGKGARTIFASIPDLGNPPESVMSKLPEALILAGAMQGDFLASGSREFIQSLRSRSTVWLLGKPEGGWGDVVGSNDYEVGAMAARTLLDAGHQRLAFLNPKPDHLIFNRREDGFRAAARRGGAKSVESICEPPGKGWELPLEVPENVDSIEASIEQLLTSPNRPTGVFAAADTIAVLAYRALTARGLVVGKDISLVSGNNDATLIAGLHPALTTCDIAASTIGEQAVRQLEMRIRSGADLPETEVWLTPLLKLADSVTKC
ncbi:MAG: LacI family DNA-binding transcriptional regulator [Verrucomicrobiota bacterium]